MKRIDKITKVEKRGGVIVAEYLDWIGNTWATQFRNESDLNAWKANVSSGRAKT